MAAELQMADFLQHVSLLMESNFVHVMTVLLASVYCNMLLIDVFGQTFVMLFPFGSEVGFSVQNNFNLLMKMDSFSGGEFLLFIDGLVTPLKPLSF